MSPEQADRLKTGFGTLVNNDCCIKAAREWRGGWNVLPPVIALVSVILAVLPAFITNMKVQGQNYVFSGQTYAYETGLTDFTHKLATTGIELEINNEGVLTYAALDDIYTTFKDRKEAEPTLHKWYADVNPSTGFAEFEVFFNANNEHNFANDNDFFAAVDQNIDVDKGSYRSRLDDDSDDMKIFQASYIAFGKETVKFRKRSTTQAATGIVCSYKKLAGFKFSSFIPKDSAGKEIGYDEGNVWHPSQAYVEAVSNAFSNFLNVGFEDTKNGLAFQNAGIFLAIDAGIILLFGLLLFLMTRGKKNPFRIYTFWETVKMSCYASFTPGLLSLIFGFWLTSYATLIFMFTFGMRIMWMTMKSLRPAQ